MKILITESQLDYIQKNIEDYIMFPMDNIRRPNGSVGTQGFSPEQMMGLMSHISDVRNLDLPQYDSLKEMIYSLRERPDIVDEIIEYVKSDPIIVGKLPDDTYHLKDGNHRANLLNLLHSSVVPAIIKENMSSLNESGTGIQSIDKVDAVLIGGLDYRSGDYPISQQVEILKKGFGGDKKVKGFRYNTSTSTILDFLSKNPKVPVFLFSAGCTKASELSKSGYVDKSKIYVIEPFAASSRTKQIVQSAVSNGVPSSNIFVGGSTGRGKGIVSGASDSQSSSHWGALSKVGSMKSGVVSSKENINTDNEKITSIKSDGSNDKPDVKKFQSWLDKKHPGWHKKYGTLGDNEDKGWGIFGPNTKRAWKNEKWKEEYLKQTNNKI